VKRGTEREFIAPAARNVHASRMPLSKSHGCDALGKDGESIWSGKTASRSGAGLSFLAFHLDALSFRWRRLGARTRAVGSGTDA
jgi:hypothetical protein